MRRNVLLSSALLAVSAAASALTLDFGNGPGAPTLCTSDPGGAGAVTACSTGSYFTQGYGDVPGLVDVTYTDVNNTNFGLIWWDLNYNSLYGVLWAGGSDASSHARIELRALTPTDTVTLSGFDLGAWFTTTRDTTVNIYAIGGGAPLYTYAGPVGNGIGPPTSFALNVSAVGGLWLEWQNSAYNVGIDNVEFKVGAVPEPASVALMLAGVAALALRRRRPA